MVKAIEPEGGDAGLPADRDQDAEGDLGHAGEIGEEHRHREGLAGQHAGEAGRVDQLLDART